MVQDASQNLVEQHKRYAEKLVAMAMRKFVVPEKYREELLSAAYLALVESAHRFDPESVAHFTTFASWRIHGAILDQLRHSTWYKRCRCKRAIDFNREQIDLVSDLPVADSLAGALDRLADGALGFTLTFSRKDADDLAEDSDYPEKKHLLAQFGRRLQMALEELDSQQSFVITKFYLEDFTLQEICNMFAEQDFWDNDFVPSRSWISKIHRRALRKLKTILADFENILE